MSSTNDNPSGSSASIARVEIDRELCIGAASCVAVSPRGFLLDDENKARLQPGWEKLSHDELLSAAKSCPVLAIYLYDQAGHKIYPT